MKRWAALLRGINLGGRTLRMADLKVIAEAQGFVGVRTLLASGNVVFGTDAEGPEIERKLESALATHGLPCDVIVRDAAELRAVLAANPYPDVARDRPSTLIVTFHRDPFPAGMIERIAEIHDGLERMHAIDRELYVDYPDGMGMSKLPAAMSKAKFPKLATARNWNTINKLLLLLEA